MSRSVSIIPHIDVVLPDLVRRRVPMRPLPVWRRRPRPRSPPPPHRPPHRRQRPRVPPPLPRIPHVLFNPRPRPTRARPSRPPPLVRRCPATRSPSAPTCEAPARGAPPSGAADRARARCRTPPCAPWRGACAAWCSFSPSSPRCVPPTPGRSPAALSKAVPPARRPASVWRRVAPSPKHTPARSPPHRRRGQNVSPTTPRSSSDEGDVEVVADDELCVGEGLVERAVGAAAVLGEEVRDGHGSELGVGVGFFGRVVVDKAEGVCG